MADQKQLATMKQEVWGLTGGIASGKSVVARLFQQAGVAVVNADHIAKRILDTDSKIQEAIQSRFKTLDRAAIRQLIFENETAKKDLEQILHPAIQSESFTEISEHLKQKKKVLYEAPLLIETGRYREFKGLIIVHAPLDLRIQRLMSRDQIDRPLAEKMIQAQATDMQRLQLATHVLENRGTLDDLEAQVLTLLKKL